MYPSGLSFSYIVFSLEISQNTVRHKRLSSTVYLGVWRRNKRIMLFIKSTMGKAIPDLPISPKSGKDDGFFSRQFWALSWAWVFSIPHINPSTGMKIWCWLNILYMISVPLKRSTRAPCDANKTITSLETFDTFYLNPSGRIQKPV